MIQNRSKSSKFNLNAYSNMHNIKLIKIRASKKKLTNGWFVFFVLILLSLKAFAIYYTFNLSSITNEFESFHYTTSLIIIALSIKNDLIVFATMLLLKLVTNTIKVRLLKLVFSLINLFIILFYVYDSILIYFSNRLYFFDIKKFIVETPDKNLLIMQVSIMILVFFWLWRIWKINKKVFITRYISLIVVFLALWIMPLNLSSNYAKQNLFSDNIFQTNLELDYIKKNKDANELAIEFEDKFRIFSWNEWKTNIILLIVESLSSIDSYTNSEIVDYMPKLDSIGKEWTILTNLKANWNTTDWWMVGILQWTETLPYSLNTTIYNNYFNPTSTLPEFFNSIWYKSIFLTTWPLDFLNKWTYLQNIQYKEIIGRESFEWEKTYTFWSPPDEILYKHGLSIVKEENEPFFLTMLTISSHLSYDTPYWKSKEEMYKYVDEKIYEFYNWLKEINYFDNWILLIVWDHRKMTPLEQWELEKYWIWAYNRIQWIVIWTWINKWIDNNLYQQTDIFYSIKNYFGKDMLLINNFNDIFNKIQRRNFTISPFLSNKNKLILEEKIWDTNNRYTIQLNWDRTDIVEYKWNQKDKIIEYIDQLRSYQFVSKEKSKY